MRFKIKYLFLLLAAVLVFNRNSLKAQICPPNFIANVVPSGNGLVNFSVTSTPSLSSGAVFLWSLAPGNSFSVLGVSGLTASTTYTLPGIYTVTLSVTQFTPTPCTITLTTTFTVNNICTTSPNFVFTQGANGLVNFTNTTTGTVAATSYTWNFGGAYPTSNLNSPSQTYTSNGIYSVTLFSRASPTVTCISQITQTLLVGSVCQLVPSFTYVPGTNGNITFTNTSSPGAGVSYTWNFGNSGSSNLVNPSYTYSTNGTYTVTLFAQTFTPACSASVALVVPVNNVFTPTCSIQFTSTAASPTSACNGFASVLNTSGLCAPVTYTWNTGATGGSVTSLCAGVYTVIASGTPGPSCCATVIGTVAVGAVPCGINAAFTYSLGLHGSVSFSNTSTGNLTSTTYSWNFRNSSGLLIGNSTLMHPSFTFTSTGANQAELIVTNSVNPLCNSVTQQTISLGSVCQLTTGIGHTVGNNGQVTFYNLSINTTSATQYYWDFGDGWISSLKNPQHGYQNGGTHYVKQVAIVASHCKDSTIQAINITGIGCQANAGFAFVPGAQPGYYIAVPSYPWNVQSAVWSWGDNTLSNALNASHQYTTAGNYNICLSVTVSCGATASTCINQQLQAAAGSNTVQINVQAPALLIQSLGSENQAESGTVNIYPNPSGGIINVVLNQDTTAPYAVANALGTKVKTGILSVDASRSARLELGDLPSGMYFLSLQLPGKIVTQRIIINLNE